MAFGWPSDPDIFENGAAISQHLTGAAAPYERGRPATDMQSMIHYGETSMATAPQTPQLPVFYKDLIPLNSRDHATWHSRKTDKATWLANQHAVPLTVEEFAQAQRHFPIIFSAGSDPVPLALMGMNEGINVFADEDGDRKSTRLNSSH